MARLEVVTGPMFSGKSEELIRRLRIAAFAEKNLMLVRLVADNRKERNVFDLVETDKKLKCYYNLINESVLSADHLAELFSHHNPDILGLDEAQFLDRRFLDLVVALLDKNKATDKTIIVSGLNLDAEGRSFGIMPELMARADEIILLKAICTKCKNEGATFTQKLKGSSKQIEVGGEGMYTVRCRKCFVRQSQIPLK